MASTGRRLLDRVHVHRLALRGQRVAGDGAGQLGHAPDVAGGQDVHGLVVLAAHDEQAVQPLVGAGAAVHEVVVVADRAGEHLEQRHLAHERIGDRLEHHRQRLPVGVGLHLHLGVAGAHRHGPVGRRRTDLHEEVGQPVDAHLRGGRAADDREHAGRLDAERERVLELLEAGHVALEVALEQRVVGDDDALHQVVVHLVLQRLHVVRDRLGVGDAALVDVRGVGEEVGDATEVRLRADRQLQRCHAGSEPVAELVERALEAGPLAVELVDEDHPRHAQPGGLAPHRLGLHLHAVDRAHHEHREVDDPQRGTDVAEEVGVAGRVDQVDLVALPLEGRHRERQRDAAALLLGIVVAHRGAVFHPPQPVDRAGAVEQGLHERRLARAPVAHQRHVADLVGREALQSGPPR